MRIDGRRDPARAYLSEENATPNGALLPTGVAWLQFIQSLDGRSEYIMSGLEALFGDQKLDGVAAKDLIRLAQQSDVITTLPASYVGRDHQSGQAREIPTCKFRLNLHHPRVQVALAAVSGGT